MRAEVAQSGLPEVLGKYVCPTKLYADLTSDKYGQPFSAETRCFKVCACFNVSCLY